MENICTIIGLVCNFIGAWCLAYDLLWGYPKSNRRYIAENKLESLESFFEQMDAIIDGWAEPPYTREEKESEKARVRRDRKDDVRELQTEIESCSEGHKEKSFLIGLFGAGLLSVGFIFQLLDLF